MRRVLIAAIAGIIAIGALGTSSHPPVSQAATPFSVSVDCDTVNSGVQSACNFPIFTTQTVDIVLTNDSGSASPIGGVTFRLNNNDIAVLSPPEVIDPDPSLNSNPDFNQAALTGTWDCNLPPAPDNDTGLVPGGTQSFINCISPVLDGPTLANGASIAIARVTYDVVDAGVSVLSLANVRIQNNSTEIHSCNPVVTVAGDCLGATVTVIALANEVTLYHNNGSGSCTVGAVPSCTVLDPGIGGGGTNLVRHLGETFDAILAVTDQPTLAQSYQWELRWTNSVLDVAGGRTALDTSVTTCSTGPVGGGVTESVAYGCVFPSEQLFINPIDTLNLRCVSTGTTLIELVSIADDPDNGTTTFDDVLSEIPTTLRYQLPNPNSPPPTIAAIQVQCIIPATLIVNSDADTTDGYCTRDTAGCTLREALAAANADVTFNSITFNIPPMGAHTIAVASALPSIDTSMQVLGTTQPGYAPNNVPIIRVDGANTVTTGLQVNPGASSPAVTGLSVTGFTGDGILLAGSSATVSSNHIGVNGAGDTDLGNGTGVRVTGGAGHFITDNVISGNDIRAIRISIGAGHNVYSNKIGTDRFGQRAIPNGAGILIDGTSSGNVIGIGGLGNQISGNGGTAVQINNTISPGATVAGNLIGTDYSGSRMITNEGNAIGMTGPGNTIGGTAGVTPGGFCTGACNVIVSADTAAVGNGISIASNNNFVRGNHIGADRTGSLPLGNRANGVTVAGNTNTIGGAATAQANLIAWNTLAGIAVTGGTANALFGNRIHSNGGLGIDLAPGGVNANDAGDGDSGPNNLLNWPTLTSVVQGVGEITVNGSLDAPAGTYFLDAYASPSCDASGNGEGRTHIGFSSTSTPSGAFSVSITGPVYTGGRAITMTATDSLSNTSEFSNCIVMDPCTGDSDCDGYEDPSATLHEGPANSNTAVDNCPSDWNAFQLNSDANFTDLTPPKSTDDKTWIRSDALGDPCDPDDDNDGLSDVAEAAGCNSSGPLNPIRRDTDLDRRLDNAECTLGSNPNNPSSVPASGCTVGSSPDTDGDGLRDALEICFYNSSPSPGPASTNTDGDTCGDAREVANVDPNTTVGAQDLGLVASAFGAYGTPPTSANEWRINMDFDKNGTINAADLGLVAARFGACP